MPFQLDVRVAHLVGSELLAGLCKLLDDQQGDMSAEEALTLDETQHTLYSSRARLRVPPGHSVGSGLWPREARTRPQEPEGLLWLRLEP